MSQIDVSATHRIYDAVGLKKLNTDVSGKTLKKLEQCAARLYGIGNCDIQESSFRGLYAGRREVASAQTVVEEMTACPAKSKLGDALRSISAQIESRIAVQEWGLTPGNLASLSSGSERLALWLLNGHPGADRAPRYDAPPSYVQAEQDTSADCITRL